MKRKKIILLLGATGRTGKEVFRLATDLGYRIHVLVRDPQKLDRHLGNIRVFCGDCRNKQDLHEAMAGTSSIISCLNISRKSDFPWSPLRTPTNFLSETMKNILRVAEIQDVNRLVFTSAWGVAESRAKIPAWFAWLVDNSNLSAAYLEHERQEAIVKASNIDWTIVRPVALTNSASNKPVRVFVDNLGKPSLTISRTNTARFLLDTIDDERYIRKIPVISH